MVRLCKLVAIVAMLDLSLAEEMEWKYFALSNEMVCGTGVPLCGTLTLETGLGDGVYKATTSKVHGLWPETGSYGTSKCIKPKNAANPTKIYDCYKASNSQLQAKDPGMSPIQFETHEWEKHGQCAGVTDVDDFFGQVCTLSADPLKVLETAKVAGKSFSDMAQALKTAGYPVYGLDQQNDQVLISACAGNDGKWKIAAVSDMPSKCGGSSPPAPGPSPPAPGPTPPAPAPTPPAPGPSPPAPAPSSGSCSPGKKGPACKKDSDCTSLKGCARCAHSGFCTDLKVDLTLV